MSNQETSETSTQSSSSLPKYFEFLNREPQLYALWEKLKVFSSQSATNPEAPVFSLTMPPPNANGELHLGHVFGEVTMDVLGRYHRAKGERVLLLPGKDHAGIQTQVVYEKKLQAEGVDVKALGREEFYRRCYEFCIDRSAYMRAQEKKIGISADWDKELFTLDPRLSHIVFETFRMMWEDGLVYRGNRIVNWSVFSQTAISDVEVEYVEAKSNLWHLRYSFKQAPREQTPSEHSLALIRFQKKLQSEEVLLFLEESAQFLQSSKRGDVLVLADQSETKVKKVLLSLKQFSATPEALLEIEKQHNLDLTAAERQQILVGVKSAGLLVLQTLPWVDLSRGMITATTRPETMLGDTALAVHPEDPRYQHLIGQTAIVPVALREIPIIADKRADMFYGTGVIKVTPAHDFPDYEMGKDHQLEMIQVIGQDGKMTARVGKKFEGLTTKACRETLVKFMEESGELVSTKEITHKVPISERGKDVIEPLLSDQWWVAIDKPIARLGGQSLKQRAISYLKEGRINVHPQRFVAEFVQWFENLRDWNISRQLWWGHQLPVWYRKDDNSNSVFVGEKSPTDGVWERDPDTFDTWFSSGQWAYSTIAAHGLLDLNNPPKGSAYFPTHTMVMGRDILFFWACRMILFSAYRLDQVPWKNIYFTGLIRDEHGQKMSKSKGNGIEPKAMIEKYGTDSIRLAMVMGTSPGNDANIGEKKIEGYSKFINKIWNSAKLIDYKLQSLPAPQKPKQLTLASSKWILGEMTALHKAASARLEAYELAQAAEDIYQFTWFTYCDWYLEMLKALAELPSASDREEVAWVAVETFRSLLLLLHPFIPFVSEDIYQQIPSLQKSPLLASLPWSIEDYAQTPGELPEVIDIVSSIRSVKAALGVPHQSIRVALSKSHTPESQHLISSLARVSFCNESEIIAEKALKKPYRGGVIVCEVEGKAEYKVKVQKDLEKLGALIIQLEKKLSGDFSKRAKADLVAQEQEKLKSSIDMRGELEKELELLQK